MKRRSPHPEAGASTRVNPVLAVGVFALASFVGAVAIELPLGNGAGAQSVTGQNTAVPLASPIDESKPHTHAEDDSSQLTSAQEAILRARVEAEGIGIRPDVVAARNSRAGQPAAAAVALNPAAGSWEGPYDWPVLGVHASLMPNGRVLAYDSVNDLRTEASTEHRFTRAMLFDPVSKATERVDELLGFNIFCSGLAKLASGVLFTAGGNLNAALDGINRSTTFDSSTKTWTEGPAMSQARWYPSVTPLANGEMLVTGGGPALSEVRQTNGTFRALTNAQQAIWAKREYQWLIASPNGKSTYVGPDNQIGFLDTAGAGSYQAVAGRDGKNRNYGSFANYLPGKVLIAGGGSFDSSEIGRASCREKVCYPV